MLAIDREAITGLSRRRRVRRLAIFGSAVTDRIDPQDSDADFLVEFEGPPGTHFNDYFGLKQDLEALLGRPVDLVMESALDNPYFAASVEANAVEIYAT